MKCDEFMSLLPLYPDAFTSPQAAADFRLHAAECPECAARLQEQEILLATLNALDDGVTPPDAFCEGWRSAVQREDTQPRKSRLGRLRTWAVAAAAVLVVVGGTAMMREGLLFPASGIDEQTTYLAGDMTGAAGAPQSSYLAADAAPNAPKARMMSQEADAMQSDADAEYGGGTQEPVVLHSAYVTLDTEQYDADIARIDQLITDFGGWSEYWSVYGEPVADNPDAGRFATMTLRVPVDSLQPLIDALSGIGRMTGTEVTAEDISDTYYDTQGRLAMYEAQRDRMSTLLSEADTMADVIQIESRLSELQYTIETLIGRLNNWNSRADNAVVRLTVAEVAPGGTQVHETIWQRMQSGLAASLRAGAGFLEDMLVFLVVIAPYLLGALVLGCIAVMLWRRTKHRRKKRRNEQ